MKKIPPPSRKSNIELLRLLCMLFVVLQHINTFESIDPRDSGLATDYSLYTLMRFGIESIAIIGVNTFVLISGWFGIKASLKGICKFVFQVIFLYLLVYGALILMELQSLTLSHILGSITMGYWFVHSYLILYILSPLINSFVIHAPQNVFKSLLIAFFVYQTLWGWLGPSNGFISMGYSAISFMGLYMIARYLRIYCEDWIAYEKIWKLWILLLAPFMINTLSSQIIAMTGHGEIVDRVYYYCSPLVILQAVSLLLLFTRIKLNSIFVNWVASSCFAVYLLHMHPMIRDYFFGYVDEIWNMTKSVTILKTMSLLILIIYVGSIIIDKIRIICWNFVQNRINWERLPSISN